MDTTVKPKQATYGLITWHEEEEVK